MSCSRTQHANTCGDQTQDLSIRSPTLYHYATALSFVCGAIQIGHIQAEGKRVVCMLSNSMITDFLDKSFLTTDFRA